MDFKFYVPTLSPFLRPVLTVFFSKTGETGDIYLLAVMAFSFLKLSLLLFFYDSPCFNEALSF